MKILLCCLLTIDCIKNSQEIIEFIRMVISYIDIAVSYMPIDYLNYLKAVLAIVYYFFSIILIIVRLYVFCKQIKGRMQE